MRAEGIRGLRGKSVDHDKASSFGRDMLGARQWEDGQGGKIRIRMGRARSLVRFIRSS